MLCCEPKAGQCYKYRNAESRQLIEDYGKEIHGKVIMIPYEMEFVRSGNVDDQNKGNRNQSE